MPNEGAGHIVYCDKQDGTEVSDTIRREKDFTTHELSDESPWDRYAFVYALACGIQIF